MEWEDLNFSDEDMEAIEEGFDAAWSIMSTGIMLWSAGKATVLLTMLGTIIWIMSYSVTIPWWGSLAAILVPVIYGIWDYYHIKSNMYRTFDSWKEMLKGQDKPNPADMNYIEAEYRHVNP